MTYSQLKKLITALDDFATGEATLLDLSDAAGERLETLQTYFMRLNLVDVMGQPTPEASPTTISTALMLLYLSRTNAKLGSQIMSPTHSPGIRAAENAHAP